MKDDTVIQTTIVSLSSSLESKTGGKYGGMIRQSKVNMIRNDLLRLFSYVNSISTPLFGLTFWISVLRMLQFMGPAICLQYESVWDINGEDSSSITIVSFFVHLIPVKYRASVVEVFSIGYIVLKVAIIASLQYFSYSYKTTSSLSHSVASFLTFYFSTFGEFLHPVALQLSFEELSRAVFVSTTQETKSYVLSLLVFLVSCLFLSIIIGVTSEGLVFRPNSMMTVSTKPQNRMQLMTTILTIIYAFATHSPFKMKVVCAVIGCILYLYSITIAFNCAGFIQNDIKTGFIASCVSGFVSSIGVLIFLNSGAKGQLLHLFALGIWFFVCYLFIRMIINKISNGHLAILDNIEENEDHFSEIKSVNHLLNIALSGYRIAHPCCLKWTIFKLAIDHWQKDVDLWYAFAKYVIMYPEENQTLGWIYNSVVSLKLKGSVARAIKMELMMMTREREFNMCPLLKNKLNAIMKHVQGTKHKLRHVWDVAIQGNIGEIEPATKRAAAAIEKNDSDFKQLFFQFPNNRFVTRAYSRFLYEIKADIPGSIEMSEKTKKLQRGILVSPDNAHELGMRAFPLLPSELNINSRIMAASKGQVSETFQTSLTEVEIDIGDDSDKKDVAAIQERIDTLTFPAISKSKIFRFLYFLVFFLAVFIGIIILMITMYEDLVSPLDYIFQLARIRQLITIVTTFAGRYALQSLDLIQTSKPLTTVLPTNLGSTWDIQKQILYLLIQISRSTQQLEDMRDYKNDVPKISLAKSKIFHTILNYSMYNSPTDISYRKYSIQNAAGDYLIQLDRLVQINASDMEPTVLDSTMILNPIKNLDGINNGIDESLLLFTDYILDHNDFYHRIFLYSLIGLIFVSVAGMFGLLYWSLKSINENKIEVYRCLTSLPKNTVSSIAENLRVIKKDADGSSTTKDSELSKQEENILKVFNTAASGERNSSESLLIIIGTVALVIIHILCSYYLYELGYFETQRLDENVPHIHYLHNCFTAMFAAISMANHFGSSFTNHSIKLYTKEQFKTIIVGRLAQGIKYFHLSWFGGRGDHELPFLSLEGLLNKANAASLCRNRNVNTGFFEEEIKCRSIDNVFNLVQPYLLRLVHLHTYLNESVSFYQNYTRVMWDILLYPVYDKFFAPMSTEIVPAIKSELSTEQSSVFPIVLIFLFIAILIESSVFYQINKIDLHLRFVLGLLQHCPTAIVLQTPKIVSVLSGKFSSAKTNTTKRDSDFFDSVFNCLPDAILSTNDLNEIEIVNKSFKRCFGELEGKITLSTFMERFEGDKTQILSSQNTTVELLFKTEDSVVAYNAVGFMCSMKYVISFTDITQNKRYSTLIKEEREKSDHLLSSILPPSLVKRVQQGEKNISFSVQSVSIVFIDIVEFTPWCGSNPANIVMLTLNNLFRKYDSLLAKRPTMTKIKCIGDCYMAAGGVFTEINQPATHAKDAVEFGLDAIAAVEELNQELNQNLRIRVGINTGGPVVGGVLGIGKPTFEILGPAINLAQQMEHHGVPMAVHISRSVYELIYGNTFKIKERGNTEIKGGSVLTYLVIGNNQ